MDLSNTQIQQFLLRNASSRPWGGVANRTPRLDKLLEQQEKRRLMMGEVGLRSQLNSAQIEQMKFNRGIAERRLGLEEGYFGISQKEMGLKERRLGLAEQEQGISEKMFGLREKAQDLSASTASWRNKQFSEDLEQKERELNLSTVIGLGTSAYAGWQSYNRNKELAADKAASKKWQNRMEELYLKR